MANSVNVSFSHTYAGKEFIQELFFKPQIEGENVFELYQVHGDVIHKKNIYLPGTLQKILKKYTTCGFSPTGSVTITDKVIETERVRANLEQCEDEFKTTIFEEAIKQGVEIDDLTGTIIEDILNKRMRDALKRDVPTVCWFGASTAANDSYDQFDGWIKRIFDAGTALIGTTLDLSSSSVLYEAAGALVTDGSLNAMRDMWEAAPKTLRQMKANVKWMVTCTVSDNLLITYENTGTDSGLSRLEEGKEGIKFRGMPVVEMPLWDENLADADNPMATRVGDNMIVATIRENLIVGTDINDPESEIRNWYSMDDEVIRMKTKFKLGVELLHEELILFAF